MERFTFAELLRNTLPGSMCLVAACVVFPDLWEKISGGESIFDAAILFGLSFLVGTAIQAIHRSTLYVPITRLLLWWLYKGHTKEGLFAQLRVWRISADEHVLTDDWMEMNDEKRVNWLKRWADQTHFLWASAWGTWLGAFAPGLFGFRAVTDYRCIFVGLGILFLIVAFIDDARHAQFRLGQDGINRRRWL